MRSHSPSHLIAIALSALVAMPPLAAATRRRVIVAPDTSHFCDLGVDVQGVTVPPEFCIRKFADVPTPRVLYFAPNGDLFVASPRRFTPGGAPAGAGAIFLFRQTDTTQPPVRYAFAGTDPSLESVHGLLIKDNTFFYTLVDGVYSVPYADGSTQMSATAPQQVTNLATDYPYVRWTHSLAAASDGSILVSSGQVDNSSCPAPDPRVGGVFRIGGSHPVRGDVVADGLRDPLYIRCMPWGACYGAELSGDIWESLGGSEKLIELHDGDHYGYPCCIDKGLVNPDIKPVPDCSRIITSKLSFPLHNTPFGFDWERNFGWPEAYRGAFFVGLHGRFGSWTNTGLQWAPTDPTTHIPTRATSDFALGFGRTGAISRVADVLFAPDGRLFFTDDQSGAIYWIAPRTLKRP
jgi:glucose/arabinose dehydrogenase